MMTTPTAPSPDYFGHLSEDQFAELRDLRAAAIDAVLLADAREEEAAKTRKDANRLLRKYDRLLEKYSGALTLFEEV